MDTANPTATVPQGGETPPGGAGTPAPDTQQVNQTAGNIPDAGTPAPVTPAKPDVGNRTIPYQRFSEVNKRMRDLERENAKLRGESQLAGYDPSDTEKVFSHPLVQELLIKNAKIEVTDYAKEYLENYPDFPSAVRKAILKNVRGFINENTRDPETAKLDVANYIDEIWAETLAEKNKGKPVTNPQVPVVPQPNAGSTPQQAGTKPAEIEAILQKSVLDWTDEEMAQLEQYEKTSVKKK